MATRQDRCDSCGGAYADGSASGQLSPDSRWARIELSFRCVGCGTTSPLDHLDIDGTLNCAHCGLDQAFDVRTYARVLATAHDVVDLAGTDPEVSRSGSALARDNPYHHIGVSVSESRWTEPGVVGGREALSNRASPGHPLCPRCKLPFSSQLSADRVTLTCPGCHAAETHVSAPAQIYPAAVALVAPAYRHDLRQANAQLSSGGAAKLTCPHCGAPLQTDSHATSVTCAHCHAPALIANKLWFRLGVREPRNQPIWVLFRGRSPRRQTLEQRSDDVDPFEAELQARARAVLAAKGKGAAPPSVQPAPSPIARYAPDSPAAPPPPAYATPALIESSPTPTRNWLPIVILAVVAVVALLGGAAAFLMIQL